MIYRATLASMLLSSAAFAGSTGTDEFGNTITGSDINDGVAANLFFDISDTAPRLVRGDDTSARAVGLGMSFSFYGNDYTEMTFATNGYVSSSPFDRGPDVPNDSILPSTPAEGAGARIYAHHDDTEATIYGAFFAAEDNPYGVDAFVAQYDALHYDLDDRANREVTIQYNVALLTDGTIIMAHNLAGPENGSGATVGIQNETFDDGVAYLANEPGGIVDGQTVIVLPPNSGISGDMRNIATEAGVTEAAAMAANVGAQLAGGASGGLTTQSANNPISRGFSDVVTDYQPWVNAGALYSKAGGDSEIETTSLFVQGGIDLIKTDRIVAGVGLAFSRGEATMGGVSSDIGSESLFAYAGTDLAGWDIGATVSYGATHYENFDTTFMGGMAADGTRTTASVSATKDFALGNDMTLAPRLSLLAGRESIDDWEAGEGVSRAVEDVNFYKTELSGKLSRDVDLFGNGGSAYVLAGVDYLSVEGDSDVTLFSAGYQNERVGGVAGIGVDGMSIGGMALSADLTATGISADGYTLRGAFTLEF